jgi:hypothetical protein
MRIDPFDQFQHPSEYLANATDENKALKRIDKRIGALAHPSNDRRSVWLWAGISAAAFGLLLINADQEVRRRIERSNSLNLTLSARQVCQIGIGLAVKGGISNGQQTLTSR